MLLKHIKRIMRKKSFVIKYINTQGFNPFSEFTLGELNATNFPI